MSENSRDAVPIHRFKYQDSTLLASHSGKVPGRALEDEQLFFLFKNFQFMELVEFVASQNQEVSQLIQTHFEQI